MVVSNKWFYFQVRDQNYEMDDLQINLLIQTIKKNLPQVSIISKNSIAIIERIRVDNISKELQGEMSEKIEPGYYAYLTGKDDFFFLYKNRLSKVLFSKWFKQSSSGFKCDWMVIIPKTDLDYITKLYLQFVTYLNYSDEITEKRISNPKESTSNGNKLINNTGESFTLIDTSWNRELIITNGVQVRGFWRLQRYGHKWTKRKLKYIDSFYRGPMVRRSGRKRFNSDNGNEVLPIESRYGNSQK